MFYAMLITLIIQVMTLFNFILGNQFLLLFDGSNQYLHFFNEFANIIHNHESIFWSWRQGAGANFFGSMTYYVLSPIMIILTLFSNRETMPYLFLIGFIIKQQLAIVTMYSLLKNFKFDQWICILISICWAFNAYFIHYTSNPMWLDILYLLPLIFLGINRIRENKKYLIFIIALVLSAMSNYYLFFSASIFVYLYLFVTYFVYEKKPNFKTFIFYFLKMTGYYLIGIGIAAVVLFPAVMAIKESPRGQSTMLLQTIFQFDFEMLVSSLKSGFFNTSLNFNVVFESQTLLYSGSLAIVMFPLLFAKKLNISTKVKVLIGGTLLLECLAIVSPFVYLVFHGLTQPICFPFRFMYGFILLNLLILAYQLHTLFKSDYKLPKYYLIFLISYPLLLLSGNGVLTALWNVILFIAYYFIINYRKKYAIIALTAVELLISTGLILNYYAPLFLSKENATQWYSNDEMKHLISTVNDIKTNDLERVFETYDLNHSERLRNMALTYGYSGLNTFTSTDNKLYLSFMNTLTLNDQSSGIVNLTGNLMSNQILNVKYLILQNDSPTPYGYRLIEKQDNYSLYENEYYMGGGYVVSNFIKESIFNSLNPMEKELALINQVIVSDESEISGNAKQLIDYQFMKVAEVKTNIEVGEDQMIHTTGIENPVIEYTFEPLTYSSAELFMFIAANEKLKKVEIIDGDYTYIIHSGDFTASVRLKDLGHYTMTPSIKVYLNEDTDYLINELTFYAVDMNSYEQQLNEMKAHSIQELMLNKNKVSVDVTADQDSYLYLSIPYSKGWEVNNKASLQQGNIGFLLVDLNQGLNTLQLTYYSPGIRLGAIVSVGALIILIITLFITKKKSQ